MPRSSAYERHMEEMVALGGAHECASDCPVPPVPIFRVELSEALFQQRVEELATRLGWKWMHIPRSQIRGVGWRTQVKGALGKGWPDLVLVKGNRLLFVELKADKGILSQEQRDVLQVLGECQKVETYVWRPRDWALVLDTLSTLPGGNL